jgi:hypothetical protein
VVLVVALRHPVTFCLPVLEEEPVLRQFLLAAVEVPHSSEEVLPVIAAPITSHLVEVLAACMAVAALARFARPRPKTSPEAQARTASSLSTALSRRHYGR